MLAASAPPPKGLGVGVDAGVVHAGCAGGARRAPRRAPAAARPSPFPRPPPFARAIADSWTVPPRPARSPVACGGGRWGGTGEPPDRPTGGGRRVTHTVHPRSPPPLTTTNEAVGTRRGAGLLWTGAVARAFGGDHYTHRLPHPPPPAPLSWSWRVSEPRRAPPHPPSLCCFPPTPSAPRPPAATVDAAALPPTPPPVAGQQQTRRDTHAVGEPTGRR